MRKVRPLGKTQEAFLECFARRVYDGSGVRYYASHYPGGGWIWDTPSGSERLAQSLERRGLLVSREFVRTGQPYTTWRLSPEGKAHLAEKGITV